MASHAGRQYPFIEEVDDDSLVAVYNAAQLALEKDESTLTQTDVGHIKAAIATATQHVAAQAAQALSTEAWRVLDTATRHADAGLSAAASQIIAIAANSADSKIRDVAEAIYANTSSELQLRLSQLADDYGNRINQSEREGRRFVENLVSTSNAAARSYMDMVDSNLRNAVNSLTSETHAMKVSLENQQHAFQATVAARLFQEGVKQGAHAEAAAAQAEARATSVATESASAVHKATKSDIERLKTRLFDAETALRKISDKVTNHLDQNTWTDADMKETLDTLQEAENIAKEARTAAQRADKAGADNSAALSELKGRVKDTTKRLEGLIDRAVETAKNNNAKVNASIEDLKRDDGKLGRDIKRLRESLDRHKAETPASPQVNVDDVVKSALDPMWRRLDEARGDAREARAEAKSVDESVKRMRDSIDHQLAEAMRKMKENAPQKGDFVTKSDLERAMSTAVNTAAKNAAPKADYVTKNDLERAITAAMNAAAQQATPQGNFVTKDDLEQALAAAMRNAPKKKRRHHDDDGDAAEPAANPAFVTKADLERIMREAMSSKKPARKPSTKQSRPTRRSRRDSESDDDESSDDDDSLSFDDYDGPAGDDDFLPDSDDELPFVDSLHAVHKWSYKRRAISTLIRDIESHFITHADELFKGAVPKQYKTQAATAIAALREYAEKAADAGKEARKKARFLSRGARAVWELRATLYHHTYRAAYVEMMKKFDALVDQNPVPTYTDFKKAATECDPPSKKPSSASKSSKKKKNSDKKRQGGDEGGSD